MKATSLFRRENTRYGSLSAMMFLFFVFLGFPSTTAFAFTGSYQLSKESTISPQYEKIGIIVNKLSSWGIGKWPSNSEITVGKIETEIIKELKDKTSNSDKKLEVIKVKSLEEAQTQGIQILYSLDYREEKGEYKNTDIAEGITTDIVCSIKRVDKSATGTNWDDLKITKLGKDLDLKVALWYFPWKRTKSQKRILILKNLPVQIFIKLLIFTANTKEP